MEEGKKRFDGFNEQEALPAGRSFQRKRFGVWAIVIGSGPRGSASAFGAGLFEGSASFSAGRGKRFVPKRSF